MTTSGRKNVIYVDDELINLFLFKELLDENYNINTFSSTTDALLFIEKNEEIDAVFSDMNMPDKNGLEFIYELKGKFPNRKMIFIIITGYNLLDEILEAQKKGDIKAYLRKPFNMDDIHGALLQ